MDIGSGQRLAWENKTVKGFNTTDVPLEICLLQGEVTEAFDAWRKGRENLGEELADIAIYLFGLAQMTGVDLQGEVEAKLAKNTARRYRQLSPAKIRTAWLVDKRVSKRDLRDFCARPAVTWPVTCYRHRRKEPLAHDCLRWHQPGDRAG